MSGKQVFAWSAIALAVSGFFAKKRLCTRRKHPGATICRILNLLFHL
jgi:hypothetical protein